jgi:hypothetical protein
MILSSIILCNSSLISCLRDRGIRLIFWLTGNAFCQNLAVKELLLKNAEAFASSKNDLGYTGIIQHQINTGNALPVKQNIRRIPLSLRQEINDELQRMMGSRTLEYSCLTAFWAPVCTHPKKKRKPEEKVGFIRGRPLYISVRIIITVHINLQQNFLSNVTISTERIHLSMFTGQGSVYNFRTCNPKLSNQNRVFIWCSVLVFFFF